jgi:predicted nuclease with TOPRIM domain
MTKDERKKIKAQLRAELTKKIGEEYQERIERLTEKNSRLSAMLEQEQNRRKELIEKYRNYDELVEENRKLREWVERMQDFCNMPPDQLKKELERMKAEQDVSDTLKMVTRYTQFIFGGGSGLF